MCAIFGILSVKSDARVRLTRMAASMRHRGPDGDGEFHRGACHLGMRRLAILDRDRGQQPFVSGDGKVRVFCNGEIYNFRELRRELVEMGYQFQSECDCEILPHAWQAWGKEMLHKLNGMFAIAVYDERQGVGRESGQLFLARDRCGQKPLYYAMSASGEWMFSSEIKGLISAGITARPHLPALQHYLNLRYIPEPDTFFEGVKTLPAGHYLEVPTDGGEVDDGLAECNALDGASGLGAVPVRWWKVPEPSEFDGSPKHAVDALDAMSRSAVALTLQSDEPVAAYLSAGVDSSLLAHYIKESGEKVTTVSIGFGADSDELDDAASFAKTLGFSHHRVICDAGVLADLPRVVAQMERPVGDTLVLAFDQLAARTQELGCKVAIGGEGADELFAGYSFHSAMLKAQSLGGIGRVVAAAGLEHAPGWLINRLAGFPADLGEEGREKIISYLRTYSSSSDYRRGVDLRTLFEVDECESLLRPEHQVRIEDSTIKISDGDLLDGHLRLAFHDWLQDWAIIRQEKNAMAHSLEYRIPFLDHRLIELAFSFPSDWKMRSGLRGGQDKWIWRQLAARRLPNAITHRPKQPFYFPLEEYASSRFFQGYVDDCLSLESINRRGYFRPEAIEALKVRASGGGFLPLKKIMALVILELWHREFID